MKITEKVEGILRKFFEPYISGEHPDFDKYQKHVVEAPEGKNFGGDISRQEYRDIIKETLLDPQTKGFEAVHGFGFYNVETDTYVFINREGSSTCFQPDDGEDYFEKRLAVANEEAGRDLDTPAKDGGIEAWDEELSEALTEREQENAVQALREDFASAEPSIIVGDPVAPASEATEIKLPTFYPDEKSDLEDRPQKEPIGFAHAESEQPVEAEPETKDEHLEVPSEKIQEKEEAAAAAETVAEPAEKIDEPAVVEAEKTEEPVVEAPVEPEVEPEIPEQESPSVAETPQNPLPEAEVAEPEPPAPAVNETIAPKEAETPTVPEPEPETLMQEPAPVAVEQKEALEPTTVEAKQEFETSIAGEPTSAADRKEWAEAQTPDPAEAEKVEREQLQTEQNALFAAADKASPEEKERLEAKAEVELSDYLAQSTQAEVDELQAQGISEDDPEMMVARAEAERAQNEFQNDQAQWQQQQEADRQADQSPANRATEPETSQDKDRSRSDSSRDSEKDSSDNISEADHSSHETSI